MKTLILKDFWMLKAMAAFTLTCELVGTGKITSKLLKSTFWDVLTPPSFPNGGGGLDLYSAISDLIYGLSGRVLGCLTKI